MFSVAGPRRFAKKFLERDTGRRTHHTRCIIRFAVPFSLVLRTVPQLG